MSLFKKCDCETLKAENNVLKSQNKELLDRLIALVDVRAYQAVSYSQGPSEDYIDSEKTTTMYTIFGDPITVNKEDIES